MKFQELFNQWIQELGCSARELSEATGLSAAVISRYRSGIRSPLKGSRQLEQLLSGLNALSERGGISERRRMALEEQLTGSLVARDGAFERFYPRFDALLSTLDISMKELSRAVNYDISFLYRIRAGKRRPHDLDEFIDRICSYTALNRSSELDLERIAELTGAALPLLSTQQGRHQALLDFLSRHGTAPQRSVEDFLRKMDGFDLADYSASLHLENGSLPPMPLPLQRREVFYGTAQMRTGQLSFFRQTLRARSREPLFMCTDMPILELAEDEIFVANWVLSVASVLEKGLQLNVIHELNRPLREMLLALEIWIPLYMTGHIAPYYLPKPSGDLYHHLLYLSGSAALTGECIAGRHDHGRYALTTDPQELSYYKTRSKDLLRRAKPLMDIYGAERWEAFSHFARESRSMSGNRRNILSRPPLYTLSQDLLEDILHTADVSEEDWQAIQEHCLREQRAMRTMTAHHTLEDKLSVLTEKEFRKRPLQVPLPHRFGPIPYTWEQYQAHVEATLSMELPNYIPVAMAPAFRNIDIFVVKGSHAVVCKHNPPPIQFVIRHPKLVSALENYVVLMDRH